MSRPVRGSLPETPFPENAVHIHLDTPDLMTRVRLESRWRTAGATVSSGAEPDARPHRIVVDLTGAGPEGVAAWRERFPEARITAFGPHVEGESLKAAKEAGADQVLPRGKVGERIAEAVVDQVW
jgi:hypothetical protein